MTRDWPRRAAAAFLYGALALAAIAAPGAAKAEAPGTLSAEARAEVASVAAEALPRLVVHDEPRAPLETRFEDGRGNALDLARFRGDVVVLNFWATWCPPCRKEMPSIDRLAASTAGDGISVVALSTDRGGAAPVERFYDEIGIENLAIYVDSANRMPREAAIIGLPVTVILDRVGNEVARFTGDTEWDEPGAVAVIRRIAALTDPAEQALAPAEPQRKGVPAAGARRLPGAGGAPLNAAAALTYSGT